MSKPITTMILPVLPLKGIVLFPLQSMPLVVGRPASVAAVHAALSTEDKTLVVVAQKDPESDQLTLDDVHAIGTKAVIKKMIPTEEVLQLIVHGIQRVRLGPAPQEATQPEKPRDEDAPVYLQASATSLPIPQDRDTETEALHREVMSLAGKVLESINPDSMQALSGMLRQVETPLHQVYVLSSLLTLDTEKEQQLLSADSLRDAMHLMHEHLLHELRVLEVRQRIADKTQSELSREQREYMLRKQLAAIQEELGEQSPEQADISELRKKLEEAELPESILTEAERELQRLERLPTASPE